MDSFNDDVTGLNSQVLSETTIYDANYSWATNNIAEKATELVAVNTTTTSNTTDTQTTTLESGNDINLRIEKESYDRIFIINCKSWLSCILCF